MGFLRIFVVKNVEIFFFFNLTSLIVITINGRNYCDIFGGPYHPSLLLKIYVHASSFFEVVLVKIRYAFWVVLVPKGGVGL